MDNAWLYIMSQCPNNETLVKFNNYFVDTWLNETSFFADKWCVNNSQHRTTNMLETWHSVINVAAITSQKAVRTTFWVYKARA